MTGDTEQQPEVEAEVLEAHAIPVRGRHRITQAEYDALRAESKARAKVTVEANAKAAAKAKAKALAKAPARQDADFVKRAKEIEAQHEASRKAKASSTE